MKRSTLAPRLDKRVAPRGYGAILASVSKLLNHARRASARAVNALMTATYWEIGRRIVEFEQRGTSRAGYGEELLSWLAEDLSHRYGRGFGRENLRLMRSFYLHYPLETISQTVSGKSGARQRPRDASHSKVLRASKASTTPPLQLEFVAAYFTLPWSHYVRLLQVQDPEARSFYEKLALQGGWSVRQLDRQISSLFYERILRSRNKAAMLRKGSRPRPDEIANIEEEVRDSFVLEFLGLKDEYSESDLEDALLRHLETFLLELGEDFAFISRQRRLRVGTEWFRIDLLFFHRRLRCLVVIDLKVGKFTAGDAGQMHLYLNYARKHWTKPDENPPVGLILCTQREEAVAHYALDGLPNKVLAREYRLALPEESELIAELEATRQRLERTRRRR